ncbi:MAG: hypothetical protein JWP63_3345 [Candidatus Solibacter sp.]|nr:hypothetical protein [Candidatus Solibacter sp.]
MNYRLIEELISLRYKLLWAKTRSRNGRIAIFLAGYLLLAALLALLTTGGVGAAIMAIRSGQGEKIAQAVLGAVFLEAILASNILGFGMNAVFSDLELRRYPLLAGERRLTRHLIGIVDPFWFLFLALELGLAFGMYGAGAGSLWFGLIAVLLLFVSNYLLARLVALGVERLMQRKGGSGFLMAGIMLMAILPSAIAPLFKKNPALVTSFVARLAYTPPFLAAAAMIHPTLEALRAIGMLMWWILALTAILIWMENRPPQRRAAESVKMAWDGPTDRVGAWFGPELGPFVAHWLRFYTRNSRTRVLCVISLPLIGFLTFQTGQRMGPHSLFVAALGTFAIVSFLGVSRIALNQFGYSGGAFRRYFLLPVEPSATLRAASYAALTIGGGFLPVVLLAWIILAPYPLDARMLFMLICSGLTGLFGFNALGLWVTLYNPRKGNYASSFGNDLSLGGNIVLIGGVMTAMLLPRLLYKLWPVVVSPEAWWMVWPLPALAAAFYFGTLRAAGPIFMARREQLLAVVEGKA